MTSFYCVYCGAVFAKEEVSEPMKSARGWVWMADRCPRCRKGLFDDWYASLNGVTRYSHVLRAVALNAVRHDRGRREGVCRAPGWDGRDGGCGRWTDTIRESGQTTLEAYL